MTHTSVLPSTTGRAATLDGGERLAPDVCVVIDTSVCVNDPDALFAYPDATVCIALTVVEELDGLKQRSDDVGRAAREAARNIETVRVAAGGELHNGVDLATGGRLIVGIEHDPEALRAAGLEPNKPDNIILGVALAAADTYTEVRVVSADTAMRLKAAALGLRADEHIRSLARRRDTTCGWIDAETTAETIDSLYADGECGLEVLGEQPIEENEFAVLRAGSASVLARRRGSRLAAVDQNLEVWGLRPRSKEQRFALDLLCDPEVPVVTLTGAAGTGKTILALAAALEQVFEPNSAYGRYERLMILRPIVAVGRQEIGFLPGTVEEKLGPWMEAIVDTMVALGEHVTYKQAREQLAAWIAQEKLTMDSVTFLRGRSITNTLVICDEVQNLEPLSAKTILTRVGEGSKLVMLGDTTQIDSPWLSEHTNALSVTRNLLAGSELFGQVELRRGERSAVAELAADRM